MKKVIVTRFGGPEVMEVVEEPTPQPEPGQVRFALTSIGMNHAELMARRGEYRILSGKPPFTPGLEGGGVIDAMGAGVKDRAVGQRVIMGVGAFRLGPGGSQEGSYRSHACVAANQTILAPDVIPDEQLGAIWLTYLTAWGCLIWKQGLRPGQFVAIPAASSGVGMAAAQVVKQAGGVAIGLTTSASKLQRLMGTPESAFDHLVQTLGAHKEALPWYNDIKRITDGRGVDIFFDPVAAGHFLETEIRCLAQGGVVWVYGLLGAPGLLDVSPLIRKNGSIRGWMLYELIAAGPEHYERGYREVLDGFERGVYRQRVAKTFRLDAVREAHAEMERGAHIGKMVLIP